MTFDAYSLSIILIGLAIGSFAKGLTGLGFPLVAIPFMATFLGAEHAIVVAQIPNMAANIWLCVSHRRELKVTPLRMDLLLPAALTVVVGVWFLDIWDDRIIIILLAVCLGGFLILLAVKPNFKLEGVAYRIITPIASLIGGFFQGVTGVSAPIFSTLIFSYRLKKESYVLYNAVVFGLFNIVQIVALIWLGMFTMERTIEGLLALIPLVFFQYLGMKAMGYISLHLFNVAVVVMLVVMEIKLIWDGVLN